MQNAAQGPLGRAECATGRAGRQELIQRPDEVFAAPAEEREERVHDTACEAIKGAIDGAQLSNLTGLLTKIHPAVEATSYSGARTSKDCKLVDAVEPPWTEATGSPGHGSRGTTS